MADYHGHPENDHGDGGDGYKNAESMECPSCGKEYVQEPSYYRHVADCTDLYNE